MARPDVPVRVRRVVVAIKTSQASIPSVVQITKPIRNANPSGVRAIERRRGAKPKTSTDESAYANPVNQGYGFGITTTGFQYIEK